MFSCVVAKIRPRDGGVRNKLSFLAFNLVDWNAWQVLQKEGKMSGNAKRFIYFCGSIRGGRDDAALYRRIIDQLKQYGEVLTEHVGEANILEKDKGTR